MKKLVRWLLGNKEWVFSGIGVIALSSLAGFFASPGPVSTQITQPPQPGNNVSESYTKLQIQVLDKTTREPVQGAFLRITSGAPPKSDMTNSDGYAEFQIPAKSKRVFVSIIKEDYEQESYDFDLVGDENQTPRRFLTPLPIPEPEPEPTPEPTPEPEPEPTPEPTPTPTPTELFPSRQISITVSETKPNGKDWDGFLGAAPEPDPALCITTKDSFTYCLPSGNSVEDIDEPLCADTYTCNVTGPIPDGEVTLQLIDDDSTDNDTIDSGYCSPGQTCEFENAIITISN